HVRLTPVQALLGKGVSRILDDPLLGSLVSDGGVHCIGVEQIISSNCDLLSKTQKTIGLCITTEQQLTTLQNVINTHLKSVKNLLQQSQLKTRINEITRLFNSLHQNRVKCEVDLNDFVQKVSTGQITSTTHAHRIVQSMYTRDVIPLDRLLAHSHTVIGSVVSLIHSVLGHLNLGSILGNLFGGFNIPIGIPCVSCARRETKRPVTADGLGAVFSTDCSAVPTVVGGLFVCLSGSDERCTTVVDVFVDMAQLDVTTTSRPLHDVDVDAIVNDDDITRKVKASPSRLRRDVIVTLTTTSGRC
ncbi:hypothetical protein HPB47_000444, partial [Ixodes persulcatus]